MPAKLQDISRLNQDPVPSRSPRITILIEDQDQYLIRYGNGYNLIFPTAAKISYQILYYMAHGCIRSTHLEENVIRSFLNGRFDSHREERSITTSWQYEWVDAVHSTRSHSRCCVNELSARRAPYVSLTHQQQSHNLYYKGFCLKKGTPLQR